MKKQYRKPELLIEEYELNASIASSCGSSITDYESIYDIVKQANPFASDAEIVEIINEMYGYDLCYHTSQGQSVFYS